MAATVAGAPTVSLLNPNVEPRPRRTAKFCFHMKRPAYMPSAMARPDTASTTTRMPGSDRDIRPLADISIMAIVPKNRMTPSTSWNAVVVTRVRSVRDDPDARTMSSPGGRCSMNDVASWYRMWLNKRPYMVLRACRAKSASTRVPAPRRTMAAPVRPTASTVFVCRPMP